jgi:hypothetical protein
VASTTFVPPENPGVVITFFGEKILRPAPSFADVVAIPVVHDWGPLGTDDDGGKLLTSFAQWEATYGTGDTGGRDAVLGAFNGGGLPGQGGAGGVIPWRMAGSAKAKATKSLNNTTPAASLVLTAKYHGSRGNDLTVTVDDDPQDATKDRLRIYHRGVQAEIYRFVSTDIAGLAANINVSSKWVTATAPVTGVALAAVTASAFAGGDDGSTLTLTEWSEALSGLEFKDFGLFAPFNLVDATIRAAVFAWVVQQAVEMRPVMAVFGGPAGEDLAGAITRTGTIRDEHVISVGVGTYYDDTLAKSVSTAQLAPRFAGVLASRGETRALTFADLAGLRPVGGTGPTTTELRPAADNGVTVLRQTSDPNSEVRVARGVTTFINPSFPGKPYDIFREPRHVRIMDNFIRNMKLWADANVIGDLTVTDDTRAAVRGHGQGMIDDLMTRNLILPATPELGVEAPFIEVPLVADPDLLDAIPFTFGWQFARTANFVIGQGRVR